MESKAENGFQVAPILCDVTFLPCLEEWWDRSLYREHLMATVFEGIREETLPLRGSEEGETQTPVIREMQRR